MTSRGSSKEPFEYCSPIEIIDLFSGVFCLQDIAILRNGSLIWPRALTNPHVAVAYYSISIASYTSDGEMESIFAAQISVKMPVEMRHDGDFSLAATPESICR